MARLAAYVHVVDPETNSYVELAPGSDVPEWAEKAITNPNAWEDGAAPGIVDAEDADPAIRPSNGASRAAWVEYLATQGVEVDASAGRNELIALSDVHDAEVVAAAEAQAEADAAAQQ